MKKGISYTFGFILLLSLVTSCKQKRVESTTYGDFRYEVTDWERKKFFWPGYDHLDTEYRLFYKGEEIDYEKLATEHLKAKTDYMYPITLAAATPTFFHRDSALYCELDAGFNSAIGVLTTNKDGLIFIPLINKTIDTTFSSLPFVSFFQIDSIGDQKVLMTNYLIHEQPFRVLAKFDRIVTKYNDYTGDTTTACEAYSYYGMSPDNKIIVRSYIKNMISYPELGNLFLTEISNGKTTEFPVMKGDSALVDFYNVPDDTVSAYQLWFKKNFEWTKDNDSYRLGIKNH